MEGCSTIGKIIAFLYIWGNSSLLPFLTKSFPNKQCGPEAPFVFQLLNWWQAKKNQKTHARVHHVPTINFCMQMFVKYDELCLYLSSVGLKNVFTNTKLVLHMYENEY